MGRVFALKNAEKNLVAIGPLEPSQPYPGTVTLQTLSFGCRAHYQKYSILRFTRGRFSSGLILSTP